MSKYHEAYKLASNLTPRDMLDKKVRKAVDLVKEACDKADKYDEKETPKKPEKLSQIFNIFACPNCHCAVDDTYQKYCEECGQRLKN